MNKHAAFRSILYVPSDNHRAVTKVMDSPDMLGADCVIFDLEDSITTEGKADAREALRAALAGKRPKGRILVRINALGTDWGTEDFPAVLAMVPDGIVLPKVDSASDIKTALSAFEASDAPESIRLWAMIESPLALMNIAEIAAMGETENSRLEALMLGTNDLALLTGTPLLPGRAAYLPWIMQCLAAARAYGLALVDGVYTDLKDMSGFQAECEQGAMLGLDGKSLIHPGQIAACTAAYTPAEADVLEAKAICTAFADPDNAGKAVLTVNHKMVEFLHLKAAQRVLAKAGLADDTQ
ncbi:MAG: CoA ester lyase [Hyphomicrobiales bacterium]